MDAAINTQVDLAAQAALRKPLSTGKGTKSLEAARDAAVEFEAMFLTQMVEQMFTDIPSDGYFGGGQGEKMFRSMLAQEYGQEMSKKGGIGIADMVQKEILKLQEEASQ